MERTYEVTLEGTTPLLMCWDNIDWADRMAAWRSSPANKKGSKAGDDRSPAWNWIGTLYNDGQQITMPTDNVSTCFMEGGALVPVPGGKHGKTFKSQSQSGMLMVDPHWPLLVNGKTIPMAPVQALLKEPHFERHKEVCLALGFELFLKRATVGSSKHIRVRPLFPVWMIKGTIIVADEQITEEVLNDIGSYSGRYKGLGAWRPGSPKKPGPHGMFKATIQEI